jgi:hypothetical protein
MKAVKDIVEVAAINATTTVVFRLIFLKTDITFLCIHRASQQLLKLLEVPDILIHYNSIRNNAG